MLDGLIVSSGIDYISATMAYGAPGAVEWYASCTKAIETIIKEGVEAVYGRRNGYTGTSAGGSFLGEGLQGYFCTISGERAQSAFSSVYRYSPHVSRLDIQTTIKTPHTDPGIALRARDAVARANARLGSQSQRNATLIEDLRGGATCYVCSKKSEQFARIYNKDAESGEERYKDCWRFEVQLKNNLATLTAEMFKQSEYDQPTHAAMFVRQWLRKRGVYVPWQAAAELYALPSEANGQSDVEARLRWLREQVAPSLRRLIKLGLRDTIIEALDLQDWEGGEQ